MVGSAIRDVVAAGGGMPNEEWIFVGRKDCDLTDLASTRALYSLHHPTHVINCAAKVGGLFANMKFNLLFFLDNMAINQNVLQCCHESDVAYCVTVISTCVFPDKTTYPIDESMLHNGPPHNSNFGFSYAKRMVDVLNRGYHQEHKRHYISAIACSVFGPYDNFKLDEAHVIPSLIHKIYNAKISGLPLKVFGTGRPLRQFIYSMDLAQLLIWTIRNYRENEPIMLSVGEEQEVSIADVVKQIVKSTNFEGEILYDTSMPEGQYKKTASNKKLLEHLPNFQFTPFNTAMEKTVRWFANNYSSIARV